MILGDREVHFSPGCISLIPTTELHTTNTFGGKAGWEWMYFDVAEVLAELYSEDETVRENMLHTIRKQGVLLTPDRNTQKMAFLIRSIFSEMENREYMYRDMVNHFLMTLVVEIIRKLQNTELPDRVPMTIDIFPAIEYIKRNFSGPIRILDLARTRGMSESHFRKIFVRYMNMKPLDYVNFVRIQRGCALLRDTDLNVSEVSDRVGYESVSSFILNFRRVIGCTPHRWKLEEERGRSRFLEYHVTALRGWLE